MEMNPPALKHCPNPVVLVANPINTAEQLGDNVASAADEESVDLAEMIASMTDVVQNLSNIVATCTQRRIDER